MRRKYEPAPHPITRGYDFASADLATEFRLALAKEGVTAGAAETGTHPGGIYGTGRFHRVWVEMSSDDTSAAELAERCARDVRRAALVRLALEASKIAS